MQTLIKIKWRGLGSCMSSTWTTLSSSPRGGMVESWLQTLLDDAAKNRSENPHPLCTRQIILGNMKSWLHCTNFSKSAVFVKASLVLASHCLLSQSSPGSGEKSTVSYSCKWTDALSRITLGLGRGILHLSIPPVRPGLGHLRTSHCKPVSH